MPTEIIIRLEISLIPPSGAEDSQQEEIPLIGADKTLDCRCAICGSRHHATQSHAEAIRYTAREIAALYRHHAMSPLRRRDMH
jgi:hypothetical protein